MPQGNPKHQDVCEWLAHVFSVVAAWPDSTTPTTRLCLRSLLLPLLTIPCDHEIIHAHLMRYMAIAVSVFRRFFLSRTLASACPMHGELDDAIGRASSPSSRTHSLHAPTLTTSLVSGAAWFRCSPTTTSTYCFTHFYRYGHVIVELGGKRTFERTRCSIVLCNKLHFAVRDAHLPLIHPLVSAIGSTATTVIHLVWSQRRKRR